jgi:lipoprotein-releasing system ATP-binding protein
MSDGKAMVELRGVRRSHTNRTGTLEILKGIDLSLGEGEMLAVVGVSGAGKTTLLQIAGTLDKPTSGEVLYDGSPVCDMGEQALASFRNRTVGFVFQFHHLLPEFDALENVLLPCMIGRVDRAEAEGRARALLDEVGLSSRITHRVGELSGGEQQRVAICRALVMEPRVLLADEPTGNLDRETSNSVFSVLLDLKRRRGLSMMMVTHNEQLAARMDRIVRIDDGRVVPA